MLGTPRTSSGNGVGQYEQNPRGTKGRLEAQVDSLLKTQTAQLAVNGGSQHPDKRREGGHGPTSADQVERKLLPTPTAERYGTNQSPTDGAAVRPSLGTLASDGTLVPTPTARDWKDGTSEDADVPRNGLLGRAVWDMDDGALVPTPRATDGEKGGPNQRGSSGDLMLPSAVQLMPTPTAQDAAASGGGTTSDVTLTDAVERTDMGRRDNPRHLLPTPRAAAERTSRDSLVRDGHWSAPGLGQAVELAQGILPREYESWDEVQGAARQSMPTPTTDPDSGNGHARNLGAEARGTTSGWGIYAAAIARHAAMLGRPAPDPTEPGARGGRRLAARFTEWLMCWPSGWVTDVPTLNRNDMLKICGNGVVTPQAEAALDDLIALALAPASDEDE